MSEKMMGLEQVGPNKEHLQKTDALKHTRLWKYYEKCAESEYFDKEIPGHPNSTIGGDIQMMLESMEEDGVNHVQMTKDTPEKLYRMYQEQYKKNKQEAFSKGANDSIKRIQEVYEAIKSKLNIEEMSAEEFHNFTSSINIFYHEISESLDKLSKSNNANIPSEAILSFHPFSEVMKNKKYRNTN